MKERNIMDVAIGSIIKEKRQNLNLSMQNIADKIGVSRTAIYYYENGTNPLTVNQLIKICNLYNTSYIEVLIEARNKVFGTTI